MKTLTLIRGLPGSGKSTLAKKFSYSWFEADDYHYENGVYNFKVENIKAAHEYCQKNTELAMLDNYDVVVSNTFTTCWEMKPYFDMAKKHGYEVQVILCQGQWPPAPALPEDVIEKMKSRFEYDISELMKG